MWPSRQQKRQILPVWRGVATKVQPLFKIYPRSNRRCPECGMLAGLSPEEQKIFAVEQAIDYIKKYLNSGEGNKLADMVHNLNMTICHERILESNNLIPFIIEKVKMLYNDADGGNRIKLLNTLNGNGFFVELREEVAAFIPELRELFTQPGGCCCYAALPILARLGDEGFSIVAETVDYYLSMNSNSEFLDNNIQRACVACGAKIIPMINRHRPGVLQRLWWERSCLPILIDKIKSGRMDLYGSD